MKMTRIIIDWTDGQYGFRELEENEPDPERGIPMATVPRTVVDCWRAILKSQKVIQEQLCALDNAWHDEWEAKT